MGKPLTWDLLVHPFFSLAYAKTDSSRPIDKPLKRRLLKNSMILYAIWKHRIEFLSSHSDRGLIILSPAFNTQLGWLNLKGFHENAAVAEQGERLCDNLKSFAIKKLGHERCAIARSGIGIELSLSTVIHEEGLLVGNSTGVVMGEYTDKCVQAAASHFSKLTGQKLRIAMTKGVGSADYKRNILSGLATLQKRANERRKKIRALKTKKAQ